MVRDSTDRDRGGSWGLARTVAAVFGVVYLLVGVAGFIQPLVTGSAPAGMDSATGNLLGLFPINAVHNIVHLLIGAALVYGAMSYGTAIMVLKVVGAAYILFGVLGLIFPNGFGLLPLGGADILLHFGTGAILLAVAFFDRGEDREMRTA